MSEREIVVCHGARTPRGKGSKRGKLHGTTPVQLATHVLGALKDRGLNPDAVGDVILGCVTQVDDQGGNIACTATLAAGWDRIPGMTVNRFCTSGLESIALGAGVIANEQHGLVVAGGVESTSRVPTFADRPAMYTDPALAQRLGAIHMGVAADLCATQLNHERMELDEYADTTRRKAQMAYAAGTHVTSLVPIAGLAYDEFLDGMPDLDTIRAMEPLFGGPDRAADHALVAARYPKSMPLRHLHTKGNSPQLADAAAAVVVAERRYAEQLGLRPRALIRATARVTVEPVRMLTGGVTAVARVLAKWMLSPDQVDVFSFGEAFSSLCVYFMKTYDVDHERFNPNGGKMALGHAFGATGTILALDVIDTLERRNGRYGVAAISGAAGVGTAILFERIP
jgi:acetyl-CoA C-acetyltransferase